MCLQMLLIARFEDDPEALTRKRIGHNALGWHYVGSSKYLFYRYA